jgi:hypothetical protein
VSAIESGGTSGKRINKSASGHKRRQPKREPNREITSPLPLEAREIAFKAVPRTGQISRNRVRAVMRSHWNGLSEADRAEAMKALKGHGLQRLPDVGMEVVGQRWSGRRQPEIGRWAADA